MAVAILFGCFRQSRHQRAIAFDKQGLMQSTQRIDFGTIEIAPLQPDQIQAGKLGTIARCRAEWNNIWLQLE